MEISDKLAFEIYTISIFHVIALVLIFSFSLYIFFRARKTPLLYSYLAVVSMIGLWIISKILKTVSYTQELRWVFIVIQYFGVDFLGFCLVVFAYIYSKDKTPPKRHLILWAVLPVLSFSIVVTNPLHMLFYSYFDFYRDLFGPLFYPAQVIRYAYLLIGIIVLSGGFTKQLAFRNKKGLAVFFSVIILTPLFANFYYILFKMDVLSWILPFPVFDFTPIAGSISLSLFMIPALTYRFFDISPVSYRKLFSLLPQGIVFMDRKRMLYGGNSNFYSMFNIPVENIGLYDFINKISTGKEHQEALLSFASETGSGDFDIILEDSRVFRLTKRFLKNGHALLYFKDITMINKNRALLLQQNTELYEVHLKLDNMAEKTKELAIAKTKSQMAQNVHDILGHSLTVVLGTIELAAADDDIETVKTKLTQVEELLAGSLNDLRNSFMAGEYIRNQTSLIKAIEHLKNENIFVDFIVHGDVYELNTSQTEAIFRLCQEAVTNAIKHGKAKTIHIILRYKPKLVEVFAVDNGQGCGEVVKNFGLRGIEERFSSISGTVEFGSDGEKGFTIYGSLPI